MEIGIGTVIDGEQLERIPLTKSRREICLKIVKTALFFFKRGCPTSTVPFRGFILEGPPSTGKTEIAKQAAKILHNNLKGLFEVRLLFVDSADIATPKWGEAEERLRKIFKFCEDQKNTKFLILFDDIDCLMMRRGGIISKEWHYSINSILFHELDKLNPSNALVIATTNRPDLIDEALRSRLYSISVEPPPFEELIEIAKELLESSGLSHSQMEMLLKIIEPKLKELKTPTIRDVHHMIVLECIERGIWQI